MATYRSPDEAWVRLDPRLVVLVEEAERGDGAGDDELDGQNGVDFADELIPDIDGRFSDGATELDGR